MDKFRFLFSLFLFIEFIQPLKAQKVLASDEFEAENVTSVTVRGEFCDVVIQEGEKVYFRGVIEGRGDTGDYKISSRMDGTRLEITVDSRNRSWGWNRIQRAKLELTIPAKTDVRVDNTSGDVYASNISGGNTLIETSSGDIEISGANGNLEIEATSGDVEVDEINGNLAIETTSGDQEVRNIQSESISLKSTSGDIEVSQFSGEMEARTTSGELVIRRGRGVMSFRTTSGNIEGYGLDLTGDLLVKATSGDIELEFVNELDQMNFDLQTSSGNLDVGSRSGERDMYIKRGPVFWVKGVTTSGNMDFSN